MQAGRAHQLVEVTGATLPLPSRAHGRRFSPKRLQFCLAGASLICIAFCICVFFALLRPQSLGAGTLLAVPAV